MPLASHRAAYEISLADGDSHSPPSGQTPVAASGLIAYEFRGSSCEGYASNFRQVTELQRNEGDPIASDVSSVTYEDGDAQGAEIRNPIAQQRQRGPAGFRLRRAWRYRRDDRQPLKPSQEKLDLGSDILFPTQHVERIIAKAKAGGGTLEARVYDGSDTGKKVFLTLTVIGKSATGPGPDAGVSDVLAKLRRWPVSVSYFDEATPTPPPEYTLSFDLYENGVSGSLRLDYGAFALNARLAHIEWLPTSSCEK